MVRQLPARCNDTLFLLTLSCHLSRRLSPSFSAAHPTSPADKQLLDLNLKESSRPWLTDAIEAGAGQHIAGGGVLQVRSLRHRTCVAVTVKSRSGSGCGN